MINTTDGSKATLDFVISSINYTEIIDFIHLAIKTKCYAVNFVPVTTFEGTEFLRINNEQAKIVRDALLRGQAIAKNQGLKTNIYSTSLISFSEQNKSYSTENIYRRIPCYVGWFRTHIDIDGEVYPCCGLMHSLSMGNANRESFRQIWLSDKYGEFRKNAFSFPERDIQYTNNRCHDCPDYYNNLRVDDFLKLRFWRWKS